MSNIAYSKRDYFSIKKRFLIDFIKRRLISRFLLKRNIDKNPKLIIYPIIKDDKNLGDILNRVSWSLPNLANNVKIDVILSNTLLNAIKTKKIIIPSGQKKYFKDLNQFNFISNNKVSSKEYSDILLYDSSSFFSSIKKFGFKNNILLDKSHYLSIEGKNQRDLQFNFLSLSDKEKILNKSIEIFKTIEKHEQSYCFTTGPSFDTYKTKKIKSNSLKIICNSIIKNDEFLSYIGGAQLLTFGDPVFHLGPSKYAAIFREKMVESVIKYDMKIIMPISSVKLLLNHYPDVKNSIIGIPDKMVNFSNPIFGKMSNTVEFNFPNHANFWVKPSGNILTWYMIPFASSLTNKIYIMGADGRKKNENYWWKHSSNVQFDSSMDSVFETHPSFFRDRFYSDYYDSHCKYMENLFCYGENLDKKYYSITDSYIPALKKRVI